MTQLLIDESLKKGMFHPWQRTIKDVHGDDFQTAHNSVNNPKYPRNIGIKPEKNRVKFTIIGDRVNKNFIHCVHLVEGLHKYRWKVFDVPNIRGY